MDQDIAVKLMMLEIHVEEAEECIPENLQPYLETFFKKYLHLMYVVGFDSGRIYERMRVNHKKTPVRQKNIYGEMIDEFESIELATITTHISKDTIYRAINTGGKTKHGHYWERIEKTT